MEILISDLLKLENPNIIDIRSSEKYNDNHILGALNINPQLLINNPDKYLKRNLSYYIYCQKGYSSRSLVQILRIKGYNTFSIIGGYEAYIVESS